MISIGYIVLMIFPLLVGIAAVSDLMTMTIPNKLSLILVAAFPLAALLAGLSFPDAGWHVLAGLGMLVLCFGLFALNWIGGGDAKLAAAIGLWLGPALLLQWGIGVAVLGGVLTLLILSARRFPLPLMLANEPWIARLHHSKTGVPYGIALAASALVTYPHAEIFARLTA